MPEQIECTVSFARSSQMIYTMNLECDLHVDEHGHVHPVGMPILSDDVIPIGSQSSCDDY